MMSANRTPSRFNLSGVWIEYLLIIVLVVLIVAILASLFGPYISNQIAEFITQISSRPVK
jgi:hypothetical protein